jgi:hypothetical protein
MTDNPLERYSKMFEDAEHTVDYWREAAKNCGEIIEAQQAEVKKLRAALLWIEENGAGQGYTLDGKKVSSKIREALGEE